MSDPALQSVPQFNGLEIVKVGTAVFPINTFSASAGNYAVNSVSVSVAHSLGYIPIVLAYFTDGGFYLPLPYSQPGGSGSTASWKSWFVYTDATNVTFQLDILAYGSSGTNGGQNVKYFLLRPKAN